MQIENVLHIISLRGYHPPIRHCRYYIRYIYFSNLQFLINVIILKLSSPPSVMGDPIRFRLSCLARWFSCSQKLLYFLTSQSFGFDCTLRISF